MFRRNALIRVIESQRKLENFRVAGDWLVYVELLRHGKIAFCRESLNSHRRHASSVTIGSFNADQLREIVKVQRFIRESFDIPHSISETADRYTQILSDRFGLTTQAVRKIWDHKEFRDFAAVVRGP